MTAPNKAAVRDTLAQLDSSADRMTLAVGRDSVALTNLSKALWPGRGGRAVTKRDLLRYLARVSPALLRHLDGRPVFVTRFPDGIGGQSFYQKVWETPPPFVRTVSIWSDDRGMARDYLLVANLSTLLWLGQQAALEFHVWFSRLSPSPDGKRLPADYSSSEEALDRSRLNYPDFLVVDLDSYDYSGREAKGAEPELHRRGFRRVRAVAQETRELLATLGLTAFVKTSGRTGLHLYVPILRRFPFEEVRAMAETIGRHLAGQRPKDVTLEWSVKGRAGRVFFDYNQNVRSKSLAAAYSPRRHPLATVSVPVGWDELGQVFPTDFTLRTVPDHLDEVGDPWADILDAKADLGAVLEAATPAAAGPVEAR